MYKRNSLSNYITFITVFSFLSLGGYLLLVHLIFNLEVIVSSLLFTLMFVIMYAALSFASKRIFNYNPIIDLIAIFINNRFKRAIRSLHHYYLFSNKNFNYVDVVIREFRQLNNDKMRDRDIRTNNFFKNPFAMNGDTIIEWEFKINCRCVIHVQSIVSKVGVNNSYVKMTNIYVNDLHATVNNEMELAEILNNEELSNFKKILFNIHFDSLIAEQKRLHCSNWRYIKTY